MAHYFWGGVRALARHEQKGRVVARMLAMRLTGWAPDGLGRAEAARLAGMDRQVFRDTVARYNAEGISGLYDRPKLGRPRGRQKRGLYAKLMETSALHPGKRIQIGFQEEARIGQKGHLVHRWWLRGERDGQHQAGWPRHQRTRNPRQPPASNFVCAAPPRPSQIGPCWPSGSEETSWDASQDVLGLSRATEDTPSPDRAPLLDLAERRSRQAKAYLTTDAGIKAQRLFECRGRVDDKATQGCRASRPVSLRIACVRSRASCISMIQSLDAESSQG